MRLDLLDWVDWLFISLAFAALIYIFRQIIKLIKEE